MTGFWENVAAIVACFVFGGYLVVLFAIFADLFRCHTMSGWAKALWIVFLIVVPVASTLVYVIVNGDDMVHRAHAADTRIARAQDDAVHRVTQRSRADRIREAQRMLDAGIIGDAEFQDLKSQALR